MDYSRAIQVLQGELECVNRDECDRECCARCDLAMDKADVVEALNMAIQCVKNRNTEQVVNARWEYIERLEGFTEIWTHKCSKCGEELRDSYCFEMPNYCPNCGAKMD